MTPEEVRIECLKLVMRRDREPAQVVDDAKVLEQYVRNIDGLAKRETLHAPKKQSTTGPFS